jgi:hypothetical protein
MRGRRSDVLEEKTLPVSSHGTSAKGRVRPLNANLFSDKVESPYYECINSIIIKECLQASSVSFAGWQRLCWGSQAEEEVKTAESELKHFQRLYIMRAARHSSR